MDRSFRFKICALMGIALFSQAALAQRGGGSSGASTASRTSTPGRSAPTNGTDSTTRPMFVSGKVLLSGGGVLSEPVAIERSCKGEIRREGYSDSKGQFSFQLGVKNEFQDASEGSAGIGNVRTGSTSSLSRSTLTSCEFRAVLSGYQSTVATLRPDGETWQFDIGTIYLKRLGDAKGNTISVTSMAAPKDAMHAYEKAEKVMQDKPEEAEKSLNKAVQIYPQFAAAWNLLGDIHRQHNEFDAAWADYIHAVAADPQFLNPLYGMAVIATQKKKWDDAIQVTNQLIKLDPLAFPLTYFFNAASNYNAQKYDAAEDSAKKFKELDTQHSHPEICLLLSNISLRREDYAGAAQQVHDYLAAVPNSPDAEALKNEAKRYEELSVSAKRN
jgi:Tfp pilus assembly protein PilF